MPVTIYPTGVTTYDPKRSWNGYTLFQASIFEGKEVGAVLVDMNGTVVKQWKGLEGFPNKMLAGGYLLGSTGIRDPKYGYQDMLDLVQVDWDGNVVWKFDKYELVKDPDHEPIWMARQHHDFQREGNPVGYYVPGLEALVNSGNTIILCHKNLQNPKIGQGLLLDDTIIEVTWDGKIIWQWVGSDHFDEIGFSEEARKTMNKNPNITGEMKVGDWLHINSVSALGPKRWFDGGDMRFQPDNLIWSSRQTNVMGIIDKETGKIIWQVGPDYEANSSFKQLGWIVGQHHVHMIPKGLPGEGNILLFDNGGSAGYGRPNPGSADGVGFALRDYSRVLEFNPVKFEIVWQYPPSDGPGSGLMNYLRLYSRFISSAQRLPNGNTLITEGGCGRLVEVDPGHEIVWEYVSPYYSKRMKLNHIYRAYRVPYEWVPQLERPVETAVERVDNSRFKLSGIRT